MSFLPPDSRLIKRLVCPVSKQPVHYDAELNAIISPTAELAFPVRDGIPIMLPEHATSLSPSHSTTQNGVDHN